MREVCRNVVNVVNVVRTHRSARTARIAPASLLAIAIALLCLSSFPASAGQWTGISVQGYAKRSMVVLNSVGDPVEAQLDVAVNGTGTVRYTCSLIGGVVMDPDCASTDMITNFCSGFSLSVSQVGTSGDMTRMIATCPAEGNGRCVAVGGYFIEETGVANHAAAKMYSTSVLPMAPESCQ